MGKKYIAVIACISLLFCMLMTSCSKKDDEALAADVNNQTKQMSDSGLITDEENDKIYVEPEYTLTKTEEKIAEKADEYIKNLDFSGTVLLGIGDHIVYTGAMGYSDKALKIKNSDKTVYQIASVTKQFTGCAILLLQEQGKLKVSDKLSRYLPDFKHGDKLTIENLLCMTTGLQDFAEAYILDSFEPDKEYPVGAMYDLIKDYELWSTPGSTYEYCNTNFYILGMVIEKVSGQTYEEFITENIFKPLHMDSSGFDTSMVTAKGYSWGNPFKYVYDKSVFWSAGAICSTVEDMFRWLRGVAGYNVINKESMEYILSNPSNLGYSCGFVVSDKGDMHHSGNLGGYRSYSMIDYEYGIRVIVLSNNEQQLTSEIGNHLREIAKLYLD